MRYAMLGNTGIQVSELCFGVLPLGPLQADISVAAGARLLAAAMEQGITFFDTAQMYGTYPHLRQALQQSGGGRELVITSKSTAVDYPQMEAAIQEALRGLGREQIDIFLLHAARAGVDVFEQRAGALECLQDYQRKGYLRAIGIATHNTRVAALAAARPEIDILFPLINCTGIGIVDGTKEEMLAAIEAARLAGKGIYGMKLLGGGSLLDRYQEAIAFGRAIPGLSALAIGMIREQELALNLKVFEDQPLAEKEVAAIQKEKQIFILKMHCQGCGACVPACPAGAMRVEDGKAVNDPAKCLLCGYCVPYCPQFCIRVK